MYVELAMVTEEHRILRWVVIVFLNLEYESLKRGYLVDYMAYIGQLQRNEHEANTMSSWLPQSRHIVFQKV